MPPPIHVLLADGHPVCLAALAEITARLPGVVVAGTVANGPELLTRLAQTPAGVVLLDADLPPAGGLESTRRLKGAHPCTYVLLLALDNPLALVKKMLAAGASGYVSKTAGREELERAIRTAAAGRPYFGEHVAAELARQYTLESSSPTPGTCPDSAPCPTALIAKG
jgi:DNA-binding NarL/FixJ family response regulator